MMCFTFDAAHGPWAAYRTAFFKQPTSCTWWPAHDLEDGAGARAFTATGSVSIDCWDGGASGVAEDDEISAGSLNHGFIFATVVFPNLGMCLESSHEVNRLPLVTRQLRKLLICVRLKSLIFSKSPRLTVFKSSFPQIIVELHQLDAHPPFPAYYSRIPFSFRSTFPQAECEKTVLS